MAMNTLGGIKTALIEGREEVVLSPKLAEKALVSLTRMLDFCEQEKL
jgi:quinolinate synthase